jgi:hypothetical protein
MVQESRSQRGTQWSGVALLAALLSVGVVAFGTASEAEIAQGPRVNGLNLQDDPKELSVFRSPQGARAVEQEAPLIEDFTPSALDVLRDFYGDEWATARAELFPDGVSEDQLPSLIPWGDAEPIHRSSMRASGEYSRDVFFRTLMAWPGREYSDQVVIPDAGYSQLTAVSLSRSTGEMKIAALDEVNIERIDSDMAMANEELDRVIHEYMSALDEALSREFDSSGLSRAPLKQPSPSELQGEVYSKTTSAGGWKSRISITSDRYPYVADLKAKVKGLRAQRKSNLATLVETLTQI